MWQTDLSLLILFAACILLKIGTLTGMDDLQKRLSTVSKRIYHVDSILLTAITLASVLSAIVIAFGILLHQLAQDRIRRAKDTRRQDHEKKLRVLRDRKTDEPVMLPRLEKNEKHHIFLS